MGDALCQPVCVRCVLSACVAGGVVGGVVLPAAPDDAGPGAAEDADRVGVVAAAGAGALVDVVWPRGASVWCCRRGRKMWLRRRLSQAQRNVALLRLPDWIVTGALAAVGGERVVGRVSGAVVADLGEQAGGGDDALGVAEERKEDFSVGVGSTAPAIWLASSLICSTIGPRAARRPITSLRRASG